MINQELQRQVAKATGWRDVQLGYLTGFLIAHYEPGPSVSGRTVLIGRRRQGAEYEEVPNWPFDLLACMRDLWPWLVEKCLEHKLDIQLRISPRSFTTAEGFVRPAAQPVLTLSGGFDWWDYGPLAGLICQAVREVSSYLKSMEAEKLKEPSDGG